MPFELTKSFLADIEEAIENGQPDLIREDIGELHSVDINSILYELNTEQSKYVIDVLDVAVSAEIFKELDEDIRAKFLREFTAAEVASFVDEMDSDDAADILNEQRSNVREEVIRLLKDEEKAAYILDLLRYEEDSAGGLMAKEFIKANINWTANQCIDEIRKQAETVRKVFSVYVVDDRDRLLGRISLKELILCAGTSRVADIFDSELISVDAFQSDEEVARIMSKYDLVAVPVINVQGKLLGRITIDDAVDVMNEQAEIERQLMSGHSEPVESRDTIWTLTRARLPWLIIGMAGGLFAATLIGFYEGQLIAVPAMAFFIPLITATGGNVGIQSSSIIVQSLASDSNFDRGIYHQLVKSILGALINGLAISVLVFGFNVIFAEMTIALVVAISLFGVVLLSSLVGTLTPLLLHRFNVNPALASGPFITTLNDLLGIAVYFGIARILLV